MQPRPTATPPATVFIVDDEADVRDALSLLLRSVALRAVAYPDAPTFLDRHERNACPACLLADLRMPGMSGLDLFAELKRRGSAIPTIVMTGHGEVSVAVRAMKAGAFDFIEKPFRDQALLDLVQQALTASMQVRDAAAQRVEIETRASRLTPREREVMDLVVLGKLNKVIAHELGLSIRTVELHRARLMEKMEAKTFSDLVRMAVALGPVRSAV